MPSEFFLWSTFKYTVYRNTGRAGVIDLCGYWIHLCGDISGCNGKFYSAFTVWNISSFYNKNTICCIRLSIFVFEILYFEIRNSFHVSLYVLISNFWQKVKLKNNFNNHCTKYVLLKKTKTKFTLLKNCTAQEKSQKNYLKKSAVYEFQVVIQ